MIVDFHTHVFPDKIASKTIEALSKMASIPPHADGTVDGLMGALEKSKTDIGIALPVLTKPTQFDSILNFAIDINARFSNESRKIISFAGIHPNSENVEEKLKEVKQKGIKGIKIHPDYQGVFIDDERYIKIISIAKELDLIVVTHAGVDDGFKDAPVRCTPERALNVINKTGHKKFVLAHYGGSKMWDEVERLLCGQDVYFDTGFTFNNIDEETFKRILSKHGADKILFATDSPWQDIKENLDKLYSFNLDKETLDKILYKNALKLLGE